MMYELAWTMRLCPQLMHAWGVDTGGLTCPAEQQDLKRAESIEEQGNISFGG